MSTGTQGLKQKPQETDEQRKVARLRDMKSAMSPVKDVGMEVEVPAGMPSPPTTPPNVPVTGSVTLEAIGE